MKIRGRLGTEQPQAPFWHRKITLLVQKSTFLHLAWFFSSPNNAEKFNIKIKKSSISGNGSELTTWVCFGRGAPKASYEGAGARCPTTAGDHPPPLPTAACQDVLISTTTCVCEPQSCAWSRSTSNGWNAAIYRRSFRRNHFATAWDSTMSPRPRRYIS